MACFPNHERRTKREPCTHRGIGDIHIACGEYPPLSSIRLLLPLQDCTLSAHTYIAPSEDQTARSQSLRPTGPPTEQYSASIFNVFCLLSFDFRLLSILFFVKEEILILCRIIRPQVQDAFVLLLVVILQLL